MTERIQIVAEIHSLIDEQMKALEGKLSHDEAVEYGRRAERIQELMQKLNHIGVAKN